MRRPLSPRVQALFVNLAHAGDLPAQAPPGAQALVGQAGSRRQGTQVQFQLWQAGRKVLRVGFRAWGCPHVLATCEWLAQRLEAEGTLASLGPPALWAQELGVPPEKLGRLLILEDALLATGQRYNGPLTSEDPGPCLSH